MATTTRRILFSRPVNNHQTPTHQTLAGIGDRGIERGHISLHLTRTPFGNTAIQQLVSSFLLDLLPDTTRR